MDIGDGPGFGLSSYQGTTIMVRSCYRDLMSIICGNLKRHWGYVITGTPGIGKTLMMYYAIAYLAHEKRKVVVRYRSPGYSGFQMYLLDFSTVGPCPVVAECTADSLKAEGLIRDRESWHLMDDEVPDKQFNDVYRTIIFTSPKVKEIRKYVKGDAAQVLYMPNWSLEELLTCRERLLPEFPQDTLLVQYNLWGGTARCVFDPQSYTQDMLDGMLESGEVDKLLWHQFGGDMQGDVRHMLLHYCVKVDGPCKYKHHQNCLASHYVIKKCVMKLEKSREQELEMLLGITPGLSSLGSLRGYLFEVWCHVALARGGSFAWRSLEDEASCLSDLQLPKCSRYWYREGEKVSPSKATYFQPESKRQTSWDAAIYLPSHDRQPSTLLIFQITVAAQHPVQRGPLMSLRAAFNPEPGTTRFVYVVPASGYHTFTKQKWLTKGNKEYRGLQPGSQHSILEQLVLNAGIRRISGSSSNDT